MTDAPPIVESLEDRQFDLGCRVDQAIAEHRVQMAGLTSRVELRDTRLAELASAYEEQMKINQRLAALLNGVIASLVPLQKEIVDLSLCALEHGWHFAGRSNLDQPTRPHGLARNPFAWPVRQMGTDPMPDPHRESHEIDPVTGHAP
jgi:hypothetical protein